MPQAGEGTLEACCLPPGHMAWVSRRHTEASPLPQAGRGHPEACQPRGLPTAGAIRMYMCVVDSREMGDKEAEQLKHHEERTELEV